MRVSRHFLPAWQSFPMPAPVGHAHLQREAVGLGEDKCQVVVEVRERLALLELIEYLCRGGSITSDITVF